MEQGARQPLQHAAGDHDRGRPESRRGDSPSGSTRSSRRSPIRRPPSTSSTSGSRASGSRSSGAGPCTWGPTCSCPRASTRIPRRAIPWSSSTATFPRRSAGSAKSRPTRTSSPTTANGSTWPATTASSRSTPTSSTRNGPGPNYPRMVIIEIQHANPFYDDSYAVNSANLGPYGDAITYELIPYLEKKYRCLGAGWARFLYGGSTGGWEALAAQVFYPNEYNGCYAACPDPIDFRAYTVVNIYKDKNAYYDEGPWHKVKRPGAPQLPRAHLLDARRHQPPRAGPRHQEPLGPAVGHLGGRLFARRARRLPQADLGQADRRDRPRSGRSTGASTTTCTHILERDWPKIGKDLEGKINIYVGDMDNYYLNNAVYLMEDFLKKTKEPALRRRGAVRRPGRALLERRPQAAQRHQPAALSPDVRPQDRRAALEDGAAGRRRDELEVLIGSGSRSGSGRSAEEETKQCDAIILFGSGRVVAGLRLRRLPRPSRHRCPSASRSWTSRRSTRSGWWATAAARPSQRESPAGSRPGLWRSVATTTAKAAPPCWWPSTTARSGPR